MNIDCISDLHGHLPDLEGGDLLIVAGDITAHDKVPEWVKFFSWLEEQNYRKKILIAGNHDGFLGKCCSSKESQLMGLREEYDFEYLFDSGIEFEGIKIWGSPWTPTYFNWHFMKDRGEQIRAMWNKIPLDTNILVTHGPAFGMLDKNRKGEYCGCQDLADVIDDLKDLKLHVFGHIHEAYGKRYQAYTTNAVNFDVIPSGHLSINASLMNDFYYIVNKPIRVIL